ncbi:AAA family ATPase [Pandoraea commovens]|nr:AAA family ATPase [Pandoraea commovens]
MKSINGPTNVNALTSKGRLDFEAAGLSIVYGENGAGKSGYSRILKAACRARDSEDILPNVYGELGAGIPSAIVSWEADGNVTEQRWTQGAPGSDDLASIAVMDSRCASMFVDDELRVHVLPQGLEVLSELARVCDRLKERIEALSRAKNRDFRAIDTLRGNTAVGHFIDRLNKSSNVADIEKLASISDEDRVRAEEVRKQLGADPTKRKAAVQRLVARIQAMHRDIKEARAALSDEALETLCVSYKQYAAARQATDLASTSLLEDGQALRGTGSDPWRELVTSAMNFAKEGPYPHADFPAPQDDARCVLCQQQLSQEASERLTRFVRFLHDDTQKRAEHLRAQSREKYMALMSVDFSAMPRDVHIIEELKETAPHDVAAVVQFIEALSSRKTAIAAMFAAKDITEQPRCPEIPEISIQQILAPYQKELAGIEDLLKDEGRQRLTQELAEFDARTRAAPLLGLIKERVTMLSEQHRLSECLKFTGTSGITRKNNELSEIALAKGLNEKLASELRALNIESKKVDLTLRGQKGVSKQQLRLVDARDLGRSKISSVLSEGEQRAIAIATFLAEVITSGSSSGIVFDDPVSSLDIHRREAIAVRLAKEAKQRQVIVFTHDLAFAWTLSEAAQAEAVPFRADRIFSAGREKGVAANGLPHEAGKIQARVNGLADLARLARRVLEEDHDPDRYEQMVRDGYRKLRDCWERIVEETLFGDTVRRFRKSVNTKMLKRAYVDDADFLAVWEGMSRCSNYTHDGAMEAPPPMPTPDNFDTDISAIREYLERVTLRAKEVEQKRVEMIPAAR